jgi:short-subunit dehydrogenase
MSHRPLSDQVLVITGASSGIGLITARKAAVAGARVFLVSRNDAALRAIVEEIEADGGRAAYAVADVGDRHALQRAASAAIAAFGRIDSWISNAGVAIYAPLLETPLGEHERLFRTNYFGAVNSAQVAVPHLAASRGTLITIGSIAGDMPSPVMGAYAASKHAIHAFIASLRIELKAAGSPVRVTLIKPSGMTTPIATHAANHQHGEARVPPPPYDPALVADAILHATTHNIRDLTVGGIGRLEVLFASHFPALFERLAPIVGPFLVDRSKPATQGDNLDRPGVDGEPRSRDEHGRRSSLYLAAQTRPLATAALAAGGAAMVIGGFILRKWSQGEPQGGRGDLSR